MATPSQSTPRQQVMLYNAECPVCLESFVGETDAGVKKTEFPILAVDKITQSPICLEDYGVEKANVEIFSCKHGIHKTCLYEVYKTRHCEIQRCPICSRPIQKYSTVTHNRVRPTLPPHYRSCLWDCCTCCDRCTCLCDNCPSCCCCLAMTSCYAAVSGGYPSVYGMGALCLLSCLCQKQYE